MKARKPERKTILLVDDDRAVRRTVRRLLKGRCEIVEAENATAARALLQSHTFALVVSDYDLPGEDGLSFLGSLRNDHPQLPRILLTAHGSTDVLANAINDAAILFYLRKPVDAADLNDAVTSGLATHASRRRIARLADENRHLEGNLQRMEGRLGAVRALFGRLGGNSIRLLAFAVAAVIALAVIAFAAGVVVLIALYIIKSALGIDVFKDVHLRNLFAHTHGWSMTAMPVRWMMPGVN